ncbi:MAG: MBL fold metallo-hydrolase [Clostridiales bacterium]|nr:MBL fold metallo-hydrolase [Clostridiales bacterium]
MKVTVLSENTSKNGFETEHGLSLYIETQKHRILFDFGASDLFIRNAEKLGIDLGLVDIAFLSHGHYDHGGGLLAFLERNGIANVYMHEAVFEPHYNGNNAYIGLDPTLDGHPRYIKVRGDIVIDDELSFVGLDRLKRAVDSHGQKVKCGQYMEKERYVHEMYLKIHEGYKDYLISGCTHKGIINLVYAFRFQAFVGGLHTMKYDEIWDEEILIDIAQAVRNSYADYYTCHCTGKEQFLFIQKEAGEKMKEISCGETVYIE